MSNYFEDFTVGQSFRHWPGRTITDFDDTWFTLMTMNTNPIHFDANFAAQSQHGQCLVNGLLVISLVAGMTVRDLSENAIANLEYESIRHTAPTFHGDTLYAESEILELTPSSSKADRGVVYVETRGVNQKGEVVLTLRRRVLVARRPAGGEPRAASGRDRAPAPARPQKKSKKIPPARKNH
ncbi:MAG TPA: MaoC family dehydratase [Candidatus Binataceae bacterium]|nr:MaoC family dehydratase [Candidatus Binataceae bacterium]